MAPARGCRRATIPPVSGEIGPGPSADREARRAVLEDALADLAEGTDPRRAAADVMRALDLYVEDRAASLTGPREPPVTDFGRPRPPSDRDHRIGLWIVLGGAVLCTVLVAILLSGGWTTGVAIAAIWVVALFVLLSS